jgi:hypothetical protein
LGSNDANYRDAGGAQIADHPTCITANTSEIERITNSLQCAVLYTNLISEKFLSLTGYFNYDTTEVLLLVLFITFMHSIYNYIPGTKHVSRVYNVAAILWLQLAYTVHVMLLQMITFCTFTLALADVMCAAPRMDVVWNSSRYCFQGIHNRRLYSSNPQLYCSNCRLQIHVSATPK